MYRQPKMHKKAPIGDRLKLWTSYARSTYVQSPGSYNHVSANISTKDLPTCGFQFDHARTLTHQFFVFAVRLVGLLLRVPWLNYKRFIREQAYSLFFQKRKLCLLTIPTSPQCIVNLLPTHPLTHAKTRARTHVHTILVYLRCFHLLQIFIIPLPHPQI